MLITSQDLTHAYNHLNRTLAAYQQAAFVETETEEALNKTVMVALHDGTIEGRNEQMRQAAARVQYTDLFEAHETAERRALLAKHELDLARVEVEHVRALLRLAELTGNGRPRVSVWTRLKTWLSSLFRSNGRPQPINVAINFTPLVIEDGKYPERTS